MNIYSASIDRQTSFNIQGPTIQLVFIGNIQIIDNGPLFNQYSHTIFRQYTGPQLRQYTWANTIQAICKGPPLSQCTPAHIIQYTGAHHSTIIQGNMQRPITQLVYRGNIKGPLLSQYIQANIQTKFRLINHHISLCLLMFTIQTVYLGKHVGQYIGAHHLSSIQRQYTGPPFS